MIASNSDKKLKKGKWESFENLRFFNFNYVGENFQASHILWLQTFHFHAVNVKG